jgi:hypothetical protein
VTFRHRHAVATGFKTDAFCTSENCDAFVALRST